jgi:hypothetical protein
MRFYVEKVREHVFEVIMSAEAEGRELGPVARAFDRETAEFIASQLQWRHDLTHSPDGDITHSIGAFRTSFEKWLKQERERKHESQGHD